jgi:ankyrin repeat protein
LHTACSSSASDGSLEVLELLLERGADGNACNKWRETPLLIASNNGHKAAVEALLQSGADPSMCSEAGWSALTFAAHKVCLGHTTLHILFHIYVPNFSTILIYFTRVTMILYSYF